MAQGMWNRVAGWAALGLLAAALAACGSSSDRTRTVSVPGPTGTPYKPYLVGIPYEIAGKTYYPRENFDYDRTGVASWYGRQFHGRRTANGEIFNMNAMTAAHPTLPMPTIARVTNLSNGKSVIVRINDRGPFASDRIIDLSRRAATELGFRDKGVTRVRVTVLKRESQKLKQGETVTVARVPATREPSYSPSGAPKPVPTVAKPEPEVADRTEPAPPPAPVAAKPLLRAETSDRSAKRSAVRVTSLDEPRRIEPTSAPPRLPATTSSRPSTPSPVTYRAATRRIYVQAGSYADRTNAVRASRKLGKVGKTRVTSVTVNQARFFRVQIGPFQNATDGDRMLSRVVQLGYPNAKIVVD